MDHIEDDPEAERWRVAALAAEGERDRNLLWGVVHNADRVRFPDEGPRPLWAQVRDICGCGSTYAHRLCVAHGADPDRAVNPPEAPDDDTMEDDDV
jgi:hypothetical protein